MTLASLTETLAPRSLDQRLARRMAIEAENARAGRWGRNGPFSAWCERSLTKPLLEYGLKAAGLYSRGVANALRPAVRNIRLTFADLPAAFDGFTILQLSDLHIDGVDGLTEILTDMLGDVRADVCV